MPFVSEAQRRLMWASHPDIAQRWADEMRHAGKSQKGLPYHHRKKAKRHHRLANAIRRHR